MAKQWQGSPQHLDERKTLIGNSWNVTVVTWLISQLGGQLGLCPFHRNRLWTGQVLGFRVDWRDSSIGLLCTRGGSKARQTGS